MVKKELIDKVNMFCDSDDLDIKKQLKSEIQKFTRENKIFNDNIYTSSFNTMILAHYDAFRMSNIKTSKTSIIEFVERHHDNLS